MESRVPADVPLAVPSPVRNVALRFPPCALRGNLLFHLYYYALSYYYVLNIKDRRSELTRSGGSSPWLNFIPRIERDIRLGEDLLERNLNMFVVSNLFNVIYTPQFIPRI